jgi:hypothetical protein
MIYQIWTASDILSSCNMRCMLVIELTSKWWRMTAVNIPIIFKLGISIITWDINCFRGLDPSPYQASKVESAKTTKYYRLSPFFPTKILFTWSLLNFLHMNYDNYVQEILCQTWISWSSRKIFYLNPGHDKT